MQAIPSYAMSVVRFTKNFVKTFMLQLLDFYGGLKVEIGEYTGRNGKYLI